MRRFLIVTMTGLFAIAAGGALAACGGGSDGPGDITEAITGADVDVDDESVSIRTDDGEIQVGGCSDIPDGFPTDDVPLPDATPDTCSRSSFDGNEAFSLSYEADDVDVDDYKSALESADFEIDGEFESETNGDAYSAFSATNDDWSVQVSSSSTGGESFVSIVVSANQSDL